ncbi:CBS domain protein [hydrothermal vent metagenome]|uniref:CBS domain protein n=1 Tax=hydrothermal vent metagenome TaxID=652676 RepID=A0A3B1E4R4_9ZZZZ
MMNLILARDIMATKLVTLTPQMDVFEAISILVKKRISGAPVVDEHGEFIGIFSEKCCMGVLLDSAYRRLPTTQLFAFMSSDVRTVSEEDDLLSIAQIFLTTNYRRLPVLQGKKLVGQISRRDVLTAAHKLMKIIPDRSTTPLYLSSLVEIDELPIA